MTFRTPRASPAEPATSIRDSTSAVDTNSQILRTTTPIFLNYNKNLVATDFGKINNLCVTCHQIRGVTSERLYRFAGSRQDVQPAALLPLLPDEGRQRAR